MLSYLEIIKLQKLLHGIILHWTAGDYKTTYNHYHFCVTDDGEHAKVIQTLSLYSIGSHTWKRNTGNIGLSFCAMASTSRYPVTKRQIETMAKLVAELCYVFNLKPDGTHEAPLYHNNGTDLIATGKTFQANNIADHCYYAEKDQYGPSTTCERWDIGHPSMPVNLFPTVYTKAIWYYTKLKSGAIKREYTLNLY